MCKSWCEAIFGVIILIFAFMKTKFSKIGLIIIAIILILHSFSCKKCFASQEMPVKTKKRK